MRQKKMTKVQAAKLDRLERELDQARAAVFASCPDEDPTLHQALEYTDNPHRGSYDVAYCDLIEFHHLMVVEGRGYMRDGRHFTPY